HRLRSAEPVRHRRVAGWVQLHAAVGVIAGYVRRALGAAAVGTVGDGLLRVRLDKSEEATPRVELFAGPSRAIHTVIHSYPPLPGELWTARVHGRMPVGPATQLGTNARSKIRSASLTS